MSQLWPDFTKQSNCDKILQLNIWLLPLVYHLLLTDKIGFRNGQNLERELFSTY